MRRVSVFEVDDTNDWLRIRIDLSCRWVTRLDRPIASNNRRFRWMTHVGFVKCDAGIDYRNRIGSWDAYEMRTQTVRVDNRRLGVFVQKLRLSRRRHDEKNS